MRTRDEEHLSFTLERNILLANGRPLLGSNWNGDAKKFVLNHNVYWDEDGSIDFAGKPFDEWKQKGIDAESVVADPRFVDPTKGDFTLKPDSPALALGFQPLDLRASGVRRDQANGPLAAWLAKPRSAPRVFPPKPAK